jgi:hypothetical protein
LSPCFAAAPLEAEYPNLQVPLGFGIECVASPPEIFARVQACFSTLKQDITSKTVILNHPR